MLFSCACVMIRSSIFTKFAWNISIGALRAINLPLGG